MIVSRMHGTGKKRKPVENISACTRVVLWLLQKRNDTGRDLGVTAGWIEDQDVGFSAYAIGNVLRNLWRDGKIGRTVDGCHIYWWLPMAGEELKKPKKKEFA